MIKTMLNKIEAIQQEIDNLKGSFKVVQDNRDLLYQQCRQKDKTLEQAREELKKAKGWIEFCQNPTKEHFLAWLTAIEKALGGKENVGV